MGFYKANDKFAATLTAGYTVGQSTMSMSVVPDNVPTIITIAKGTTKEAVYTVQGKTINSVTGVAWLRGYAGNLDSNMPVTILNNAEFLNQYQSTSVSEWVPVTYAADIEIDLTLGAKQVITLAGNANITVSGVLPGQPFVIKFIQNGTGGFTPNLFSTINWRCADHSFNTAANKVTILGFIDTGSETYDGFLVGKDY